MELNLSTSVILLGGCCWEKLHVNCNENGLNTQ